ADGADAFTPLTLAAAWTPQARLGTAIVPVYTRGPSVLAQSAAALAEAAPGRFVMGVGTSSNVIVQSWNDIPFVEPYKRTRDVVRFLRKALAGERVDEQFDTFTVRGFRLGRGPKLKGRWGAWAAGDRKAATAAIPDEVVDELIIHGSPESCRRQIQAYADNGVTTLALWLMAFGVDGRQAARALAPTAG